MKVAVFSTKPYDREFLDRFNAAPEHGHALTYFEAPLNSTTANITHGFDAVCVFTNDKLDPETIQILGQNGVKAIVLRCAGFNNVDLATAADHRLKVMRVPAYSPQAVAEHAVALVLTLNRKTHKAYNRVRESNFALDKLLGFNLYKKTVSVIGTGKIGACFAHIMLGFGCTILAYDLHPDPELQHAGVTYTSLESLYRESDIISLHCPLTPETRHLIGEQALAQMKPGVMLINTSRGAVIDTQAAIEALKTSKLGYLGIDVYEQEETLFFKDLSETIISDDLLVRLMGFPNVLITAHQGFFTKEAMEQIAQTTLQNLSAFEKGNPLENEIKPAH